MQVHAVPPEERAFNSKGERLPWGIDYLDESRNSRRPQEEWGSFGKNAGRKGSSRASRTATPAKKENPTIDSFALALKYDQDRQAADAQQQGQTASSRVQSGALAPVDGNTAARTTVVAQKAPTQVILRGYSPSNQWAAIEFYERVSGGLICEDYERQPPFERRRYQSNLSASTYVPPRALSRAEKALATCYHGGDCWITVTFDSAEAAERAIYNSPHLIQGHWVYAEPFEGKGPDVDEPILYRLEDREPGLLDDTRPSHRPSQTLGPSFSVSSIQDADVRRRSNATLPRSFTTNASLLMDEQALVEVGSFSSSTASSATATGPEYPDLKRQRSPQNGESRSSALVTMNNGNELQGGPPTFTHFPDIPKTHLCPASEAFLPQKSWSENVLANVPLVGGLQSDVIGSVVPRLENGDFDWARASFYWKICYWLDTHLGTDLCGMREN
ncbi:MAG: hypothetical protein FRX48_02613 [Lasallia pustulata]|uniref:Uncharacterized protein n=1 Tax=Lasallia pustulata TaxID=136370 RepID=A0A5M8PZY4_9LECA|nr:MAG: hypothetical protein FRX48_02613 [Lasallia pustulata]